MLRTTHHQRRAAVAVLAILLQAAPFAAHTAGADPAAPSFDILEFDVDGNTVLTAAAIERAVTPFLGESKQMSSVEDARAALEKAYQSAGYLTVFVDVPEQRVDSGLVRLTVLEGKVDRLKVTGSRYFSQGYIRERVPELADGKVPNFNEVQRELALVNRTEDRRVQPIMRAGTVPGTVETELKVDDKLPLHGSVEVSNRAAADTRPLRISLNARYENLWQLDHSIAVTLLTAPQDTAQSRVATLNYTIPSDDGAAWVGYAIYSDSTVAAIGDVNVLGKGTTLGFRYVQPLGNATDQVHSVSYGLDFKDMKQESRAGDSVISTPLRYLPLQFAYNGSIDHGARRQTQLGLLMTASLRPIFRRDVDCPGGTVDQFLCSRQGGDGGFATLRGDLRHGLPLGTGAGSLNLRLNGQIATGPVPNGEQFTAGGAETVRGYHEAEAAGDRGLLGTVEWRSADLGDSVSRWLGTDPSPTSGTGLIAQTYALAFVDAARAYVFEPATGQAPWISLAGAGFGVRTKVRNSLSGEFDLAWPFKATQATQARSPRAHLKLALDF